MNDLSGLWWQIALGVFLGLIAHSAATGLYARWELYQAVKQLNSEAARQMRYAPPHVDRSPSPLRDGERCLKGRRFTREPNGWRQLKEPC